MKNLIFALILALVGLMLCQPPAAFAQNGKTIVKIQPPKLLRHTKPKKTVPKRKVDKSKIPYLISVRPAQ